MKSITDIIKEDSGKLFNVTGKADLSKTYIICDTARADWGKSDTLLELIRALSSVNKNNLSYSITKIYKTEIAKDRHAFFIINGVKIFVGTAGDTEPIVNHNLELAFKWQTEDQTDGTCMPNVVVIAARSSGDPIKTIRRVATQYNCNTIWFRNFHDEWTAEDIRISMSKASAESIILMIKELFA